MLWPAGLDNFQPLDPHLVFSLAVLLQATKLNRYFVWFLYAVYINNP